MLELKPFPCPPPKYKRNKIKRVFARLIGNEYINVFQCGCGFKWDRVDDRYQVWIICPHCKRSGASKLIKKEKL